MASTGPTLEKAQGAEMHAESGVRRPYGVAAPASLLAIYLMLIAWIMLRSDGLPYAFDGNETFSSLLGARNLIEFGASAAFLMDESTSDNAASHPYVYTHGGNFPRLFTAILLIVGINSPVLHIAISAIVVGSLSILLFFYAVKTLAGSTVGWFSTFFLLTSSLYFLPWATNAWRVWQLFFMSALLFLIAQMLTGRFRLGSKFLSLLLIVAATYTEIMFGLLLTLVFTISAGASLFLKVQSATTTLRSIAAAVTGFGIGVAIIAMQIIMYLGPDGFFTDLETTFRTRNSGEDSDYGFFIENSIVFWQNNPDVDGFRSPSSLLLRASLWETLSYGSLTLMPLLFTGALLVRSSLTSEFIQKKRGCSRPKLGFWYASLIANYSPRKKRSLLFVLTQLLPSFIPTLMFFVWLQVAGQGGTSREPSTLYVAVSAFVAITCGSGLFALAYLWGWDSLTAAFGVSMGVSALQVLILNYGLGPYTLSEGNPLVTFTIIGLAGFTVFILRSIGAMGMMQSSDLNRFTLLLTLVIAFGVWLAIDNLLNGLRQSTYSPTATIVNAVPSWVEVLLVSGLTVATLLGTSWMKTRTPQDMISREMLLVLLVVAAIFAGSIFVWVLSPGYIYTGYLIRWSPWIAVVAPLLLGLLFGFAWQRIRINENHLLRQVSSISLIVLVVMIWYPQFSTAWRLFNDSFAQLAKELQRVQPMGVVTNNYAGPIAWLSDTWAYQDLGVGGVYEPSLERQLNGDQYVWLRDWRTNSSYRNPDAVVCFAPGSVMIDWTPSMGFCTQDFAKLLNPDANILETKVDPLGNWAIYVGDNLVRTP